MNIDHSLDKCPICGELMGDDSIDGICEDCHPLDDLGVTFKMTLTLDISFAASWALRKQKMVPGQPPQLTPELLEAIANQIEDAIEYQRWERTITVGPVSEPEA